MPVVHPDELYSPTGKVAYRGLFTEWDSSALLSLADNPPKGKVCLRNLYFEFCVKDPTETDFAEHVFGDVSWWFKVRNSQGLKHRIDDWAEICNIIRKRDAFKSLVNEVKTGGKSSVPAARYLIEETWRSNRKTKRSIEDSSEKAFTSREIQEDLDRING